MSLGPILVSGGGADFLSTSSQTAWDTTASTGRSFTNSNFTAETTSNADNNFIGLGSVSSGLVYLEFLADSNWAVGGGDAVVGFGTSSSPLANGPGFVANSAGYRPGAGQFFIVNGLGGTVTTSVLPVAGGVAKGSYIQFLLDMSNARCFCGFNGDWGTQDPFAGTNPVWSGFSTASPFYRHARPYYSGDKITITSTVIGAFPDSFTPAQSAVTWGN